MGTRARSAALALAAAILALALLEGAVAPARFGWLALGARELPTHVRYDPDLGCSHVPGGAPPASSAGRPDR
jgi:hypothetical protein